MESSQDSKLLSVPPIKHIPISQIKSFTAARIQHIPIIVGSILGLLALKSIITVIYNVYFHPLRKYPGPKLAAATGLVYFYHLMLGNEAGWTTEMHMKYGEVVRIGPDRLTYISPQAWKDISGPGAGKRLENTKDSSSLGQNIHGYFSMGAEPDTAIHRQRRRIYAPAFSERAVKLQEPLILGYVSSLLRIVKNNATSKPDAGFDIVKLLNCTTFDVMADLSFGEPLGLLEQSEYTPWVAALFGNLMKVSVSRLAREYKFFDLLIKAFTPKSVIEGAHSHYNHSYDRVVKRMGRGIDIGKPDITKLVLEKKEKNDVEIDLGLHQMTTDAASFMLAGTETSATLLSGLLYLLLKHPERMQRLQADIRALDKKDLRLEPLYRLPFMTACISEAFRIYPPVAIPLFRITPKGGNKICDDWIPERTRVGIPHYAAYHSPLNFKDPESFIPERWLPGTGYDDDRKDVLHPFSHGPRNCIGQNLANHEIRIILATLIWHFDFELCPESERWLDQKVHFLWVKPELLIKAKYIR